MPAQPVVAEIRHVLGTDTGVGKTRVTGLLLELARVKGLKALPLKPVHSGWPAGQEWGCDLEAQADFLPAGTRPEQLCRYPLAAPISPFSAAALEKKRIELAELRLFIEKAGSSLAADMLFVEGIGGICCPLGPDLSYLDFLMNVPAPAILVSRVALGSLNHAILSHKILRSSGIPVEALVLNEERPYAPEDLSASRARWELEQILECPVLGPMKYNDRQSNLETLSGLSESFWTRLC